MTFIIHKYSGPHEVQKRASTGRPENTFHQTRFSDVGDSGHRFDQIYFNPAIDELCDIEYQLRDHKIIYFSVI